MPTAPTPHDEVPDFMIERFSEHSPEELRSIASYAETLRSTDEVPQYVVQAFAIQDDETRTVVAIYAAELADYFEAKAEAEPDEDEDDDPAPGRVGGAFFG
ncbi:hypothetical protein GS429_16740 [Natronorubrum sp. JWXQ-INN-674]|uniref:Uncharacterized protein n=1 Tax=Natronorubrum halalkaliphilum TaxID=2691917 RepID=A0A6B0VRT2_9EURY|nr:hypothetical protein [Natronorubrum halalkaliphilum]MXV63676.1 hypothetical protein [Natronorubrum halalkaliphilum]